MLKKHKPNKIILHLITSLPLILLKLFKFKTEFVLRISGYPKVEHSKEIFLEKHFKKIRIITCPTLDLKKDLENLKIFDKKNLHYLPDAIIKIRNLKTEKTPVDLSLAKKKELF